MEKLYLLFFIASGIVLAFVLYSYLKKPAGSNSTSTTLPNPTIDLLPLRAASEKVSGTSALVDSYQRELLFENYVISLFDKRYFEIQRRSEQEKAGVYPISSTYPDLTIQVSSSFAAGFFAVDCVWKDGFVNEELNILKDYELKSYRSYQEKHLINVFILLGVGGEPNHPAQTFLVPLNELRDETMSRRGLEPFLRVERNHARIALNLVKFDLK